MDFKPAIKTLGQLLLLLVVIGIIVVASAGAINYGFRAAHRPVIGVAGALNLILGGIAVGRYVIRQIRGNNL